MMRWGGIFADFYRWREGVGPRDTRRPMLNLLWGGIESNQVGTAEFVDLCRRVGAEPLICVNFESDGRKQYMNAKGGVRTADAKEAAEWVAYCNDPENAERRRTAAPRRSASGTGRSATKRPTTGTASTSTPPRVRPSSSRRRCARPDPAIQLIAWGDSGWAPRMAEIAGEHVQYLAFHHMFDPDSSRQPVLRGETYRRDPDAAWSQLMTAWQATDTKIRTVRDNLGARRIPLALTECHFVIPGEIVATCSRRGRPACLARILNNHQRHGDVLKIATAADFCGTRWQNNAVIIPTPKGNNRAYLQPVARVMQLYRHHIGSHAIKMTTAPDGLDVAASRRADTLYLHVANTQRTRSVTATIQAGEHAIRAGRVFEITADPAVEVSYLNSGEVMKTVQKPFTRDGVWEFPAASVSALELELAP